MEYGRETGYLAEEGGPNTMDGFTELADPFQQVCADDYFRGHEANHHPYIYIRSISGVEQEHQM